MAAGIRKVGKVVKNCHMEGQWPWANCKPGGSATCYYIIEAAPSGGAAARSSKTSKRQFILCASKEGKARCCDIPPKRKSPAKRKR